MIGTNVKIFMLFCGLFIVAFITTFILFPNLNPFGSDDYQEQTRDQEINSKRFTNTFQRPQTQEEANAYIFTNNYGGYPWSEKP